MPYVGIVNARFNGEVLFCRAYPTCTEALLGIMDHLLETTEDCFYDNSHEQPAPVSDSSRWSQCQQYIDMALGCTSPESALRATLDNSYGWRDWDYWVMSVADGTEFVSVAFDIGSDVAKMVHFGVHPTEADALRHIIDFRLENEPLFWGGTDVLGALTRPGDTTTRREEREERCRPHVEAAMASDDPVSALCDVLDRGGIAFFKPYHCGVHRVANNDDALVKSAARSNNDE